MLNTEGHEIRLIHGDSGAGKSSIIQAGVVPEIEKTTSCFYVSFNKLSGNITKSEEIIKYLLSSVKQEFPEIARFASLKSAFKKSLSDKRKDIVMFIDQFEQLFDKTTRETIKSFVEELAQLSMEVKEFKVVIVIRSDYFGNFDNFVDLKKQHKYFLNIFNSRQARAIIRNSFNAEIKLEKTSPEASLLEFEDIVINDLQDRSGLIQPVELSLICDIMMKKYGTLSRLEYLEGGKKDGLLNIYFDEVLQGYDRKSILSILLTMIEDNITITRTVDDISYLSGENPEKVYKLLKNLEESRIVIREKDSSGLEFYTIAHQYLIAKIELETGNIETALKKYSRLLANRSLAWETEQEDRRYLLRADELYGVLKQRKQLNLTENSVLKKRFLKKSIYAEHRGS